MLLEGGLDWRAMSMSPKDMDFTESKRQAARDIALALGVPPMLLGIPGDNTHANYQEANRAFWRHTVLPLTGRSLAALSNWLGAAWGGGLELRMDLDGIQALSAERDALWARVGAAAFLSDDEKRAAVGYGAKGSSTSRSVTGYKLFNPGQPRVPKDTGSEGGRWAKVSDGASPQVHQIADKSTDRFSVVLSEEEIGGGHTIREHVAVTDEQLIAYVRGQMGRFLIWDYGTADGRFLSMEAASDFVNRTLRLNMDRVNAVASGAEPEAVINQRFGSPTGTEAYSDGSFDPVMRSTFEVRMVIRYDTRSPRGFRVVTAFPVNQKPKAE